VVLLVAALSLGFVHTLLGPDHYVPFVVIGRARRWGLGRTSLLTFVCGLGHVLSSVLLGLIGVAAGAALHEVEGWESARGGWAAWGLLVFGAVYAAWGVYRAMGRKTHSHAHLHSGGRMHSHTHDHGEGEGHPSVHDHDHEHENDKAPASWRELTPWLLFLIFVLGPCEPLIPLFFASAVQGSWAEVLLAGLGYLAATLFGMQLAVALLWFGLKKVPLGPLERWSHFMAGSLVALAGTGMIFLGL
jgi:ABC-type nickel/cobalt efflux system permease component RcnA